MPSFPGSALFKKNDAEQVNEDSDSMYMAVLIFLKCLDLRKNAYSRPVSLPPLCGWYFANNRKKSKAEYGFTLIELIVVMTLIGIMLSLTVPALHTHFFTDPLKATTRRLIGLVTGVRELAVRSQQPYLLHISRVENRIWYEPESIGNKNEDSDTERKGVLVFPESVRISAVLLENDEDLAQDRMIVWVSKQGYMVNTLLRIEDQDGNHMNVQFYPFLDPALVADEATPF
jgi:prepilin-type N-terminal cleavage/methylation domain-containing protein